MTEFITLIILLITVLIAVVLRRIQQELHQELNITTWGARGFLFGFTREDDPLGVIHIMAINDIDMIGIYLEDCRLVFVTGVKNPEHAARYMRGEFKQSRKNGFNTLYYTPFLWLSIQLIKNRSLQKEVRNALRA